MSWKHIIHRSGRIVYVAAAATHSYKQFILLCPNIVGPHLKEIYDGKNQLFSFRLGGAPHTLGIGINDVWEPKFIDDRKLAESGD